MAATAGRDRAGGLSCRLHALYWAAGCFVDGPHGYSSRLNQPLPHPANRGHPVRLPLLVHRLKPRQAGEARRARHLGERERIKGGQRQRACSLICLPAKVV